MTRSPIRLDCSPCSVVVVCDTHPWWRAFRWTKADAWDAACLHEELEHDGDNRQRRARNQRRCAARHAAHS